VRLSKNGAAFAQKNDGTAASHDENGWYTVDLDATDTGTLGRLKLAVNESGALPVWLDFMVIAQEAYDAKVNGTGDGMRADMRAINGDLTNGNNATLSLKQIDISNSDAAPAINVSSSGRGISVSSADEGVYVGSSSNHGIFVSAFGTAMLLVGTGSNKGLHVIGGNTGHAVQIQGGSTSGNGIDISTTDGDGIRAEGANDGAGLSLTGGAFGGHGIRAEGGSTSGNGIDISTTDGDGIRAEGGSTSGNGMHVSAAGSGHGFVARSSAGSGAVIETDSGGSDRGLHIISNSPSGPAFEVQNFDDGGAVYLRTAGGNGVSIEGGVTGGKGVEIETADGVALDISAGGSGNSGIRSNGTGSGSGMELVGGGSGRDLHATLDLSDTDNPFQSAAFDNLPDVDLATNSIDSNSVAASGANEIKNAILSDGVPFAGANINAPTGDAATPAEVLDEAKQALIDYNLDHLMGISGSGTDVADNSILAQMLSKAATADFDTFDNTSDSLEAISDNSGSGLTQQQVRDAMKLAPSGGAAAAGSVDEHLDETESKADALVSRVGVPGDLGSGADLGANVSDIAGGGFSAADDSQEALRAAIDANAGLDDIRDVLFNRNVVTRHANEKPSQYTAGTGGNQITVNTTQDGNGNTETETIAP
jgi:hypothetical protein